MDSEKQWQLEDGTLVNICKMSDLHIRNTLKLLRRKYEHITADELRFKIDLAEFKGKVSECRDMFVSELQRRKEKSMGV